MYYVLPTFLVTLLTYIIYVLFTLCYEYVDKTLLANAIDSMTEQFKKLTLYREKRTVTLQAT